LALPQRALVAAVRSGSFDFKMGDSDRTVLAVTGDFSITSVSESPALGANAFITLR